LILISLFFCKLLTDPEVWLSVYVDPEGVRGREVVADPVFPFDTDRGTVG
jgi:hypothetical protein